MRVDTLAPKRPQPRAFKGHPLPNSGPTRSGWVSATPKSGPTRLDRDSPPRAIGSDPNFEGLVREDKDVLRHVHPSKSLPDEGSAQRRIDSLLQGFRMFRYDDRDQAWYDAHPLCWSALGFADDLPSWEQLANA